MRTIGRRAKCSELAALLACFLCTSSASAATNISRFDSPMTPTGLLGLDTTQGLYPDQWAAAAYLLYTRRPFEWRHSDDTYEPIIGRRLRLDLVGGVGINPIFDIAVAFPITFIQKGPNEADFGGDSLAGAGIGDLRVIPRLSILKEQSWGVGLALIPEITFPTGFADRFLGDPSVAFKPRAVASWPLFRFVPIRLIAGLGYNWRRNRTIGDEVVLGDEVTIGDEWLYSGGAEVVFEEYGWPVTGLIELDGAASATDPFSADKLSALEVRVGARVRLLSSYLITFGVGGGVTDGVGAPSYRFILGAAWAPLATDRDGDGIPDLADECPDEAEDFDRFEDTDGCPELDNDEDGITDSHDKCPLEPEDINGIVDDDGCPDAGFSDRDRDGIPDDEDSCPVEPEDVDGFEDGDGCPDFDHDHDGIRDDVDECPTEKETINGVDDYDGCPDEGEGVTEYVERVRINLTETILFESGRSTIKAQSKPALNQVALQILAHPEIELIHIEGHTDSVGSAEGNLQLSQDRADAVRNYLVDQGVSAQILEAIGYGEGQPIATNDTAQGRARNRRVEFVIVRTREPQ